MTVSIIQKFIRRLVIYGEFFDQLFEDLSSLYQQTLLLKM